MLKSSITKLKNGWYWLEDNPFLIWIGLFFLLKDSTKLVTFNSLRNGTSDAITTSSIILAILGIFLGILMSLKDDSEFSKRLEKYDPDKKIIDVLFRRILHNFYLNVCIIIFTIGYDLIKTVSFSLCISILNTLWLTLFAISILEILYLVQTIGRIYLFKNPGTKSKFKS